MKEKMIFGKDVKTKNGNVKEKMKRIHIKDFFYPRIHGVSNGEQKTSFSRETRFHIHDRFANRKSRKGRKEKTRKNSYKRSPLSKKCIEPIRSDLKCENCVSCETRFHIHNPFARKTRKIFFYPSTNFNFP